MLRLRINRARQYPRGQTLTEMALIMPLFVMLLVGIVVLGLGVFYDQQVVNAAREAARYASVHSATSQCPTVSNRDPDAALLPLPNNYYRCDAPENRWPEMTAHARSRVFGLERGEVRLTACWSGYWTGSPGSWGTYDQVAMSGGSLNHFRDCTVRVYGWTAAENHEVDPSSMHVINPRTGRDATTGEVIRVDCTKNFPLTTVDDDMASNYSASNNDTANEVTVLICYPWRPPLAGFLLIPRTVTLQAVVSEGMEYQQ